MESDKKQDLLENGLFSFDPIVLVRDVIRRWALILLVVVIAGTSAYVVADVQYEPVYRTQITFVVTNRSSSSTVYTNLSSATSLAEVFADLLNSYLLRETIVEELGGVSFNGTIQATMINETNLLTVTVSDTSPRTAFLVARAIIEHHGELTYQVVDNVALEVLQWPVVPAAPSNFANAGRQMRRIMLLAAVAMAALVAYISFVRDAVRSGKEAQAKLDCDYLGEIGHERRYKTPISFLRRVKTNILITNPAISFHYVEGIRKIRHRVEQRMRGSKVLMVTSTLEGEGKSTVAVNLALSMAQKQQKVLLIDCDLYKPNCQKLLRYGRMQATVRDVLRQKIAPEEAVCYDRKRNLWMLLGKTGGEAANLFTGAGMSRMMEWARENFDVVVLDMPPMSVASDAETVMEYADASLLIVRQNAASTRMINKNIEILHSGNANLIGCIVNNIYSSVLYSGEGYGYGRYGSYGRYGKYGRYGRYGHYHYYDHYSGKNAGNMYDRKG